MAYIDPMFMDFEEKKYLYQRRLKRFCRATSICYYLCGIVGMLKEFTVLYYLEDVFFVLGISVTLILLLRLHYIIPCIVASRVTKSLVSDFLWGRIPKDDLSIFPKLALCLSSAMIIIKWIPIIVLTTSLWTRFGESENRLYEIRTAVYFLDLILMASLLSLRISYDICRKKEYQKKTEQGKGENI